MNKYFEPYFAVIFTSQRTEGDNGYAKMSDRMQELAKDQPGYLGFESASGTPNISISYWETEEDIVNWKANMSHQFAQSKHKDWYKQYRVRVCKVEREYGT